MAAEVLAIEARLKDFISANLTTLEKNIGKFSTTAMTNFKSVSTASSTLYGELDKMGKGIASVAARFGPAALAASAAMYAFTKFKESVALAGQLQDMSDKLGVSTTLLQQFARAGLRTGVAVTSMTMALKTFQIAQYNATNGNKQMLAIFEHVGIATSGDVEAGFRSALVALSKIEKQADRTALATKLFGKSATELIPLINNIKLLDEATSNLAENEIKLLDDMGDRWALFGQDVGNSLSTAMLATLEFTRDFDTVVGAMLANEKLDKLGGLIYNLFHYSGKDAKNQYKAPKAPEVVSTTPEYDAAVGDFADDLANAAIKSTDSRKAFEAAFVKSIREQLSTDTARDTGRTGQTGGATFGMANLKIGFMNKTPMTEGVQEPGADTRLEIAERIKTAMVKVETDQQKEMADRIKTGGEYILSLEEYLSERRIRIKQEEKDKEARLRKESIDATFEAGHAVMNLGKQIIQSQKMDAQEKKDILKTMAIADAAGAAVKGIYDVWQGEGEVWYKIAMTAVTAADIIAAAWVQIDSINNASFARGTASAPGGGAIVAEDGMELVAGPRAGFLPAGSRVVNARDTAEMLGGSNVTLNLNVPSGAYITRDAASMLQSSLSELGDALVEADRRGSLRTFKQRVGLLV